MIGVIWSNRLVNVTMRAALFCIDLSPGGGGDSRIKRGRMLVVSLRGVNFGFWSHLGCSGQNAIICSREGLL